MWAKQWLQLIINKLNKEIASLNQIKQGVKDSISLLNLEKQEISQIIKWNNNEIFSFDWKIITLNNNKNKLKEEISLLLKDKEKNINLEKELKNSNISLEKDEKKLKKELKTKRTELKSINKQIEDKWVENYNATINIEKLDWIIKNLNSKKSTIRKNINNLSVELDDLKIKKKNHSEKEKSLDEWYILLEKKDKQLKRKEMRLNDFKTELFSNKNTNG